MKTFLALLALLVFLGAKAAQAHGPSLPPDPWVGGGAGSGGGQSDGTDLDD